MLTRYNFSPAAADARELWSEYLRQPQLYPREPAFHDLLQRLKVRLQGYCGSQGETLFLTCAGTPALECAIAALPLESRILVIRSGYFGERLFQIARTHFHKVHTYDLNFGESLTVQHEPELHRLIQEKRINVLLAVHLETSSTILNDMALLGKVGRETQALTLVDGVSSLGATEVRLEEWGIDCFIASVYKALQCPEGLSFIIANQRYFDVARRQWSFSFDLGRLLAASRQNHYLWMPLVLSLQCLEGELAKIEARGQENYFTDIRARAAHFRQGLRAQGLKVYGDPQYLSASFTALELPKANADLWLARLLQDFNIVVGKGAGEGADNFLRIGHYPGRGTEDLDHLITALATISSQL